MKRLVKANSAFKNGIIVVLDGNKNNFLIKINNIIKSIRKKFKLKWRILWTEDTWAKFCGLT
jgi:hypothetical protein